MSQPIRELDFGIRSEPRRGFDAGMTVVQFNLEHGKLLYAYRVPALKCPVKTDLWEFLSGK
jgi:hypothetical protein